MTKTKYYDLQMDDPQDDYDVDVVNANLKKIDEQMKTRENATDALQEPEFTVAAKRENIASKEKMPKILGKIAKFFADLKTVAFSGKYNDLDGKPAIVNNNTTTEPGSALDARQANPNIEGTMAANIQQINSNLKLNIPLIVKYIDDIGMLDREPRYFCDLQSGAFAYILICPTGDGVIGFNYGESKGKYFAWQMYMSGYQLTAKIRNCGWGDAWSEWKEL